MFQKLFFVVLLGFFALCSMQEINPKLVLYGYDCKDNLCNIYLSHCNPLKECQCGFGHIPSGGREYKECGNLYCYIDEDCNYFYGPNTECHPVEDGVGKTCRCQSGWSLNQTTQECTISTKKIF